MVDSDLKQKVLQRLERSKPGAASIGLVTEMLALNDAVVFAVARAEIMAQIEMTPLSDLAPKYIDLLGVVRRTLGEEHEFEMEMARAVQRRYHNGEDLVG
jgi:hypothetical protein